MTDGHGGGLTITVLPGGAGGRIERTEISGNEALGSHGDGGAFTGGGIDGAAFDIKRSLIAGNRAESRAGAFILGGSFGATIEHSTISGNTAGGSGPAYPGAIEKQSGPGTLTLRFTTFTNNANADGALTLRSGVTPSPIHISGSIVDGDCNLNLIDEGQNVERHATCGFAGTGAQNADPLLAGLADNGGATRTHAIALGESRGRARHRAGVRHHRPAAGAAHRPLRQRRVRARVARAAGDLAAAAAARRRLRWDRGSRRRGARSGGLHGARARAVAVADSVADSPTPTPGGGGTPTPPPGAGTAPRAPGVYIGATRRARRSDRLATYTLTYPRGCLLAGQPFDATLTVKRRKRKGNLFVKVRRVDFYVQATRVKIDRKPVFRQRLRVPAAQRAGTPIKLRARAFIKVRRGRSPTKSLLVTLSACR